MAIFNKVPFKAQAIARDLAVRLKNRIADLEVQEDLDADRFPTLRMNVAGSTNYTYIRIATDSARSEEDGHVDGLGIPQRVYTPHKVEIVQEDAATAAAETIETRTVALYEASKLGMKLSVREGPAVMAEATYAAADALAATTVADIRSDDVHPLTKQM